MLPPLDLIVNPAAGPATARLPRADRLAFACRVLAAAGAGDVRAVESRSFDEGAAAAQRAVRDGVARVVVWGGDGTVHAVAEALGGSATALAIVPGGSGNGFARALGVPLDPEAALRLAVAGTPHAIDLGVVNGHTFINIVGLGLDAAIARRFNLTGGLRRGLGTYIQACLAEVGCQRPTRYTVRVDGNAWFTGEADLVAVANGQQYGHGACIAPAARMDDGRLEVVVVPDITRRRVLRHGWRLFAGSIGEVPGVRMTRGAHVVVETELGALMHRDGETHTVTGALDFSMRPLSLQVVVPRREGRGTAVR